MLKQYAQRLQAEEYERQLADSISVNDLLVGTDVEKQASELRKILILAGMDVDVDLQNPEMMKSVQEVLANFDPSVPLPEDDAVFSAQMMRFDKKEKKQKQKAHFRRPVVKKVDDLYLREMQQKEAQKIEEDQ